jgi:hypothetical protein
VGREALVADAEGLSQLPLGVFKAFATAVATDVLRAATSAEKSASAGDSNLISVLRGTDIPETVVESPPGVVVSDEVAESKN